jgi:transcriptional regulator with XRE-family HTH domain|tara:strand:+ start:18265 stop:18555 length:291 start_codon:yes stop_codon:yes gene_type:complete
MTDNINFHWGYLIREIRQERNISIKQLSQLADISESTAGCLERKMQRSTIQTLEKILFALGYELEAMAIDNPKPIRFFSAKTMKGPNLQTHMKEYQ